VHCNQPLTENSMRDRSEYDANECMVASVGKVRQNYVPKKKQSNLFGWAVCLVAAAAIGVMLAF
jgi:hypothetical protein